MNRLVFALLALSVSASASAAQTQVFIAGDSTASEWAPYRYPQLGWGMVLKCAFGDDVVVHNYAQSGRSTKSFITQGFFSQIESEIQPGDTLLIQFGHNDAKTDDPVRFTDPESDYRVWLKRYVDAARAKGAQPVLITPVARRKFENGVLVDTHGPYSKAVREVAAQTHTPLIDLTADSMRWLSGLGDQGSKAYFLVYTPEDHIARFPNGNEDNTHFNEIGARKVANLVATRLAELKLPISKRIKATRPGLTRDTPLGGPSCTKPRRGVAVPSASGDPIVRDIDEPGDERPFAATLVEGKPGLIFVTATGMKYDTLQAAVDALPAQGGEITLSTGVYREKVVIAKPNVRLQGVGNKPQDVILASSDGTAGLRVTAQDFRADNLAIQAAGLSVTGDRAMFTRVKIL